MDPKDFAIGEAEKLDHGCRLPLYSTMELYIETLTGTCFELRVSPYETVISVKAKIQRLEGVPIGQQYLIWQNTELEDEYCLRDYNITDGCTLKLVLAMRGGPINTRRIAVEEPDLQDVADYVESNQVELFEKPSPPPSGGNKQVTLLVYRDGDQLNFFRVVDRGDGTLTPFSESLSGSACNLREPEGEDETRSDVVSRESPAEVPLSIAQMAENNVTATKMKQLRSRMSNLQLSANKYSNHKPNMAVKATPLVSVETSQSSQKLNNSPTKSVKSDVKSIKKSPRYVKKAQDGLPAVLEPQKSSGKFEQDHVLATRDLIKPESTFVEPSKAQSQTVSRAEIRRAQFKRMKSVNDSQETIVEKINPVPSDVIVHSHVTKDKEESILNKPEVKKDDSVESMQQPPPSGRFSPRTRRLLNALENSHSQRKKVNNTAMRSPRSNNALQGMTFNRHDLYLRSYGLLASPNDAPVEKAPSLPSDDDITANSTSEVDSASKMFETSQGLRYSTIGGHQYWGGEKRLLQTPPVWGAPKDPHLTGPIWLQDNKKMSSDVEEIKPLPPSSLRRNSSFQQSSLYPEHFDDSDKKPPPLKTTKSGLKYDSFHLPHPPPVATSNSKQRPNRMFKKPLDGASMSTRDKSRPDNVDDYFSARHPLRQSTGKSSSDSPGKSALRVEPPRAKVESMSRQEAREVVDFINKAVDASILRNLVRSPNKDLPRGSSGQNSHRISASRNSDMSRGLLKSSHGANRASNRLRSTSSPTHGGAKRTPQTLPPVKLPSKKKRCFVCAKRTGLATSYVCRCGNNFCASHRYAETHNCTYDYKTAGRKILEEANPLVSAPKLPKI
ncbi:AN1-type zinc finger protein 4-like [Clavelina lepadiformis]|uniref:AN1-type zinc finger protein 4-like n=1 Tax=Clavelina lepadiformis TaxID=159417 RepID=UPI004041B9B0